MAGNKFAKRQKNTHTHTLIEQIEAFIMLETISDSASKTYSKSHTMPASDESSDQTTFTRFGKPEHKKPIRPIKELYIYRGYGEIWQRNKMVSASPFLP